MREQYLCVLILLLRRLPISHRVRPVSSEDTAGVMVAVAKVGEPTCEDIMVRVFETQEEEEEWLL